MRKKADKVETGMLEVLNVNMEITTRDKESSESGFLRNPFRSQMMSQNLIRSLNWMIIKNKKSSPIMRN